MNCHDLINRFDDFLDGLLGADEVKSLRSHIAGCPSCASELESTRSLRERAASLPRSLEPQHDLWPGIAARISETRVVRGRFTRRALLAAAATFLVISSLVTAYFIGRSPAVTEVKTPAVVERSPEVLLASFESLGVNDSQATRRELLDALAARSHELSPETLDVVRRNLLLIDQAMDRIAEALGEDPENELLMKQLAGVYRRQIGLLERAVRLPPEV